ncbi:MAG: transglutaminase domain-containing protein, partial [Acidobacteriaceae bacterium]|nr:transglutaminase domain-containing protein [Acidobacteriaceae bacterium]
ELTRGVDTQYDKARLIGHFVQGIRYVAIEMDSTHGGTYRPHKAEMVFGKRYGDCKDKANLMRAMLKIAGIDSYLVLAHSGDRTFVSADWPSPYQFNHMIVAVRVCDGPQSATLSDSLLGPLLFFDPTDDATAFGDFPSYEQGSLVLVCAAERGQLLVVPMRTPDSNTIDRVVDARLKANGGVEAVVSTVATGQPARDERARLAAGGPERYKSETQRSLFPSTRSATVSKLETADVFEQNIFKARLEFSSAVYGEAMQHSMVVFDPSMLALDVPAFAGGYRAEPILLQPLARHTKVRIELPPGYSVDEIPQGLELETEFARFRVAYNHAAGELDVDEELRTEGVTLPASESIRVKRFFDEVRRADNQEAVLVRLH